jgi:hypothetical protein
MASLEVRQATLDDTAAISRLFRQRVDIWQRLDAQGHVEEPPYDDLTIYERWLHGGPWMSIETSAIFLSHLLKHRVLALVAESDGEITGYAEAYPGSEPAPYGTHLHLGHLLADDAPARHALMTHVIDESSAYGGRLTVAFSAYDRETRGLYESYQMQPLVQIQQVSLPASTGQSFYKATPHSDDDPAQIAGWHMIIGRWESARQHWETLWPRLWDAVPEITARRTHRLRFSAAGQDAFLICQQLLYTPRSADIFCWSPKPLTSQLLVAIRDWAHRENYRTLVLSLGPDTVRLVSAEAETMPYRQDVYLLET